MLALHQAGQIYVISALPGVFYLFIYLCIFPSTPSAFRQIAAATVIKLFH